MVAHLFLVGRKAASRQDDRLVRLDVLGSSVVVGANADDSTVLIGDQAGGNGLVQNFGAGAFNSRLQGTEESHAGRLGLGHMTARSRRGHFLRFARELVARIAQADALFAIGEVGLKDFSREVDALLEAPVVNVLGLLGDKLQGVDVGGGAGHLHHVVEEVLGAVLDAVLLLQRGSAQVDETTVESGRAAANAGCLKDDDFGTGLARLDGGCRAGASKTYHDDVGLFVPCHRIGSNAVLARSSFAPDGAQAARAPMAPTPAPASTVPLRNDLLESSRSVGCTISLSFMRVSFHEPVMLFVPSCSQTTRDAW